MDPSLIGLVDVSEGLKPGGLLIVNTDDPRNQALQNLTSRFALATVNATAIAIEVLRVPIVNTAIIGSLVKASELCSLVSLHAVLQKRFGSLAEMNWAAMQMAHNETQIIGEFNPQTIKNDETGHYAIDALFAYEELEPGADVVEPGSSAAFHTGNWRSICKPATDLDNCIKCGFCWLYCPDIAYRQNPEGFFDWDSRYCKGCGICALECPKGAISMREEKS
jgi:pyruvate ferredoxin oxidoreductase delta subunit